MLAVFAPCCIALVVTRAVAAPAGGVAEPSEALFVAQIVLLLLCGRLLGEAMQRAGQSAVMGQLLAGVILGPSVLGALLPASQHAIFGGGGEQKAMIEAVSDLGILMLLLLTGMELDIKLVKKARQAAFTVSIAGLVVPFACGFALGQFLPDAILPKPEQRLITSLFLGTALSVASVKIVAAVVREMGFLRRKIGMTLIASAIIDDTIGWIIIAITSSLALNGVFNLATLMQSLVGTGLFLLVSFTLGRRLVFGLIRWTNDALLSEAAVITAILIVMGTMALITHALGIHTVLGAFIAGILVGESPILARHIELQLRGLVVGLFMPVFFSLAGLNADMLILKDPRLLAFTLILIAIASAGKFIGAFAGGALARLTPHESLALACGMNARGSTEVIVASVGLSLGVISADLFTMIVTMAVLTTLAMPPTLRWALSRLPLDHEEQARLDREAFEVKGFLTKVERLLIAVDDSANGRLALHLATLIAASRGITATILHLETGNPEASAKTATARSSLAAGKRQEERNLNIHEIHRTSAMSSEAAIRQEAEKGYGLLILGIAKTVAPHGGFRDEIARLAATYEGPLAIVVARGLHADAPGRGGLNILVPVRGNEASRRGAEVALALAQTSESPVTALYVLGSIGMGAAQRRLKRPTATRRHEEAVLKDIVNLADRHGQSIRTALRLDVAPEDAILRQARLGHYNLIVMGVGRPAGEALFFGKVAAAVLESSDHSLLFLSS
ncbi:MAG TPA: cation:proton antiporter [Methylocella sp.]|nr:cation:proton antiporter [Methylocella sp.]